ncbi:hypothetical protein FA95DRAFT_1613998 [Auriscalpium vulgare]|uniref:Uncharacterized protein n=1 Tax=Auriscalpium vulgare TaxID=40419 RepID=A0ACB8R106_9AGAM|nr:hypothetical protein FA95DRAFT_1613998 [Auriscalpium vulgare]
MDTWIAESVAGTQDQPFSQKDASGKSRRTGAPPSPPLFCTTTSPPLAPASSRPPPRLLILPPTQPSEPVRLAVADVRGAGITSA